jgi:hypothetical protein
VVAEKSGSDSGWSPRKRGASRKPKQFGARLAGLSERRVGNGAIDRVQEASALRSTAARRPRQRGVEKHSGERVKST